MSEPPKYVRSRRGGFKRLHRRIQRTLCCKVCHAELERTPSGYWTCPTMQHGKLIPEPVLLRRLARMLRKYYPSFRAKRILKLRHKVALWAARYEQRVTLTVHFEVPPTFEPRSMFVSQGD